MTCHSSPKKNALYTSRNFQACYLLLSLKELKIPRSKLSRKKEAKKWQIHISKAFLPYCQEKITNKESRKFSDFNNFYRKMSLSSLKKAITWIITANNRKSPEVPELEKAHHLSRFFKWQKIDFTLSSLIKGKGSKSSKKKSNQQETRLTLYLTSNR